MKPNRFLDFEAEYYKVKKNNRCLAKALTEQQQLNKKYLDENVALHKKLHISLSMNMQYERNLNQITKSLKNSLNSCIDITNDITTGITLCKQGINIPKTALENLVEDSDKNALNKVTLRSASPGNPNKTHAVKPMVSGHVIHSPTINLSRLIETQTTGVQSVDNTVQIHNSSSYNSVNNHETLNNNSDTRSLPTSRLPIRGFVAENTDNETDDSLDEDSMVLENENGETSLHNRHDRLTVSLEPLLEESDEDFRSPNANIVKEVRILIEPLHLENNYFFTRENSTTPIKQDKPRGKRFHDDPLEGTSSMLDASGNLLQYNYHRFKPRQSSKRMCIQYESDSEESTFGTEQKTRRYVTKRKPAAEKKDITGQKYKIKRNRSNGSDSNNDSLEILNDDSTPSNSFEEIEFPLERKSRRSAPKNLAEPSLRTKLRR